MASISPLHGGLVWKSKTPAKKTGLSSNDFAFLRPAGDSNQSQEEQKKSRDINELFDPQTSSLSIEQKIKLITSVGQQVIKKQELPSLLSRKPQFTCYDGFQPSGRMHIAQGILKSINVNKMTKAGGIFIFWVADWFALMNNKMGGDMYKIRRLGQYFIEVWRAAGMDLRNVKFLWASDHINSRSEQYWGTVLDIARRFSLNRIKKCGQIMGRQNEDELSPAQIIYPCMQCTDIFYLGADICQLGVDQTKVNMLAREYVDIRKDIKYPPVIVSHHMLMGLKQGEGKMSKSDPDSAIFMQDTEEAVNNKINKKAFCAPGDIKTNPVLEYAKYIVFEKYGECLVERVQKNGGNKLYKSYEELESDFEKQLLHPGDLKKSVAKNINKMLEPVRRHFEQDLYAKQLLAEIKSWK